MSNNFLFLFQIMAEFPPLPVPTGLPVPAPVAPAAPTEVPFNPWTQVESLEDFLFYFCPECDTKHQTKSQFISHALGQHPNSHCCAYIFSETRIKSEDVEVKLDEYDQQDDANGADWDYYDQDWQPECKKEKRSYDYYYDEDQYEPPYKAPKSSSKPRKNQDGSKKMGRPAKYKTIEVEVKAESYLENQEAMDETQEKVVHYRCEEHNLTFEYLKKMYLHNKKYHPENVHKRKARGKSEVEVKAESYLENPELMDDNKDQKVGEDGFDDKMIKKEFQEDQSGVQGNLTLEKKKPISCCLCDMRFEDTDLLKLHTKQLHCNDTKDSLDCHECPARYPLKKYQEFLYHLKVHHGLGDYLNKCDQCDQVFETKQHLHRHKMNKHSEKRLVFCQKCGKCFQTMGGLHGHMLHVHGEHKVTPQDKIKKCDTCDLDFESPLLLDMHLKSCLKEFKDFPCKFCDSRWVSHLSLELHLAVEHNKLMVVCEVCGSVLRDKYYLSSHMKQVHEKTRSVVCHICARVLSTKGRLNEHLAAVHGIGEKKYQCDICQERFAAKQMLNEHFEKVHDTDNVYQCSYCPKTFQVKGYLRTHVKNIHGNHKPNKCDVCDAAFLTKRDLLKHKSSVH